MRIYLICIVRNRTREEQYELDKLVARLEVAGHEVFYPLRDTNIDERPSNGLKILRKNMKEMTAAEVVVYNYSVISQGSAIDFGMALMLDKPIVLGNRDWVHLNRHMDGVCAALLALEKWTLDDLLEGRVP